MREDSIESLAADLKRLAKVAPVTYRELAKKFGVSISSISDWLNGKSLVRLDVMQEIVKLTDGDVDGWTERRKSVEMSGKKTSGTDKLTDLILQIADMQKLPSGAVVEINIKIRMP